MQLTQTYNLVTAKLAILKSCRKTNCSTCPLFDKNTVSCSVLVKWWTKLPIGEEFDTGKHLGYIDWKTRWEMRKDHLKRQGFSYERRGRRHVWSRGGEDYDVQELKDMTDAEFESTFSNTTAVDAMILPRQSDDTTRGFSVMSE